MTLGPLIILSGPSGSGKSTVIRELLQRSPLPLYQSLPATTRRSTGSGPPPRAPATPALLHQLSPPHYQHYTAYH